MCVHLHVYVCGTIVCVCVCVSVEEEGGRGGGAIIHLIHLILSHDIITFTNIGYCMRLVAMALE